MSPPSCSPAACRLPSLRSTALSPPLLLSLAKVAGLPMRLPGCSASTPALLPPSGATVGPAVESGWRSDRKRLYLSTKLLPCCCAGCACCCRRARHSAKMSTAWPFPAAAPLARQLPPPLLLLLPYLLGDMCNACVAEGVVRLMAATWLPCDTKGPAAAWLAKVGCSPGLSMLLKAAGADGAAAAASCTMLLCWLTC